MATNPRLPDQNEHRGPSLVPKVERPKSAAPGVILAIITAGLLIAAIVYFMPRAPKATHAPVSGATLPAQPVPGQLAFSDMNMTIDPTGQALNLDGEITNNSNEVINGVMAQVSFTLKDGKIVTVNAPVQGIDLGHARKDGAEISGSTQNLVNDPIKAGEERAIMINVPNVPKDWNHTMPGLAVVTTTGTTSTPKK